MVLSSLDTHHISPHARPPKMTKLFSKLKLFYISPQKRLHPPKMTKLFPNSPRNYYNHKPTSGYDQKTITITSQPVDMTRKLLQSSQK